PKLLVNSAACERELGDLPAAANDLRHFIDDASESQEDPFLVDKARGDLRVLEKKVGRVSWNGWPQKSTFEVDGHLLRDPAYVKPGEHHVKGRTPGGAEVERDVTVGAGSDVEVVPPPLAANEPLPIADPDKQ